MTHVFITGAKGAGKSVALASAIRLLPAPVGGLRTWFDAPPGAPRTLYLGAYGGGSASCVAAHSDGFMAKGQPLAFDAVGAALLRRAYALYPAVAVDELGRLEKDALAFQEQMHRLLDGDKPFMGVIQAGDIPWLHQLTRHPLVVVLELTPANRAQAPQFVADLIAPQLRLA